MRFLIATGIYPPDVGGPATVIANLVLKLRAAGHHVQVVTYGDATASTDSVVTVSRRGATLARYVTFCRAIRSRLQSDTIVLATDVFSVGIPSRLALVGRPNTLLLRLGGEWCWEDAVTNHGFRGTIRHFWNGNGGIRRMLMKVNYRWIIRRASRIAVTAELLREVVGSIVQDRKAAIEVIPNESRTMSEKKRPATGPHDPLRLLYVGRFAPVKNLPFFARMLRAANNRGVRCACDFIGDGPDLAEVREILHDIPGMTFHGKKSNAEIASHLIEADFLALPSLSDMYPNSVVEALAVGLPCLITTAHGMGGRLPGTVECDPLDQEDWIGALLTYQSSNDYEALRSAVRPLSPPSKTLESFVYGSA